jgi:hypothetical protein
MAPMIALGVGVALVLLVAVMTLVGRQLVGTLPYRLRPRAKLYLAPALGLALLVIVASTVGRFVGFVTVPGVVTAVTAMAGQWALSRECNKIQAITHALLVAMVSLVAGSAILMSVLRYGGYDSYSDAFTYLVHGNWLQHHGFIDFIPPDQVEPYSTQIYLYQVYGFRMGASYVLGWVQAAAGLEWSYLAYPVVLSLAAAAFSFAVLFAASLFCRMRRVDGYLLACLPALSPGAMTFSMIKGFLPQSFGLMMGLAFLSLGGALIAEFTSRPRQIPRKTFWGISLILGGLGACAVTCYSELSPFLAVAIVFTVGVVLVLRPKSRGEVLRFVGASALTALVLLNWEAWRAVKALQILATGVVGWPVDWPAVNFLGFAFGLHGGSGDYAVDWLFGNNTWLNWAALAALLAVILWAWQRPIRIHFIAALPLLCFGGLCAIAFAYFRYVSASPFPIGKGQSWSEFKLANWVFLVTAVLTVGAVSALAMKSGQRLAVASLLILIGLGLAENYKGAAPRTAHVIADLGASGPIFDTALELRADVKHAITTRDVVYLDTGGLQKLQQLIIYFLYDVHITSNWLDNYIGNHLPADKRVGRPEQAKYVVELSASVPPALQPKELWTVGSLTMLRQSDAVRYDKIVTVSGGYEREVGPSRWWYWVNERIDFQIDTAAVPAATGRLVSFEYWLSPDRSLTLEIVGRHDDMRIDLPAPPAVQGSFEKIVPASFGPIEHIILTGEGQPTQLSQQDPRVVRFLVANLNVEILDPGRIVR